MSSVQDFKFQIQVAEFNNYLHALVREAKGATFKQVIRGEAGSILGMAAQKTNAASLKEIKRRYTIRDRSGPPPNPWTNRKRNNKGQYTRQGGPSGGRTGQDPKLVDAIFAGGKRYFTKNYYPNTIYKKVKKALKDKMDEKKARRMSGRATWYLIAKKCRAPTRTFKTLAGIQKAIRNQSGKFKSNKTENGIQHEGAFSYGITIKNGAACALNKSARGSFALRSAMAGRPKQFQGNVKRKVFNDAKKRAKQYPNIYVTD